jgi:hypothetical protein
MTGCLIIAIALGPFYAIKPEWFPGSRTETSIYGSLLLFSIPVLLFFDAIWMYFGCIVVEWSRACIIVEQKEKTVNAENKIEVIA